MPRLHLAHLVVAFLLKNARTTTLDLLARVSVLEGVADKQPGTWMRDKVPEREIVEVFGPEVKEAVREARSPGRVAVGQGLRSTKSHRRSPGTGSTPTDAQGRW
jgi:hypothetical protein